MRLFGMSPKSKPFGWSRLNFCTTDHINGWLNVPKIGVNQFIMGGFHIHEIHAFWDTTLFTFTLPLFINICTDSTVGSKRHGDSGIDYQNHFNNSFILTPCEMRCCFALLLAGVAVVLWQALQQVNSSELVAAFQVQFHCKLTII